jgi:cation transport ATPase
VYNASTCSTFFNYQELPLSKTYQSPSAPPVITLRLFMFIAWLAGEWSPRSARWLAWTVLIAAFPVAYLMIAGLCAIDMSSSGCLITSGWPLK